MACTYRVEDKRIMKTVTNTNHHGIRRLGQPRERGKYHFKM
jgi:hypothetical protein